MSAVTLRIQLLDILSWLIFGAARSRPYALFFLLFLLVWFARGFVNKTPSRHRKYRLASLGPASSD